VPVLPIGAKETGNFLRKVGEFAGIETSKIENFIKKEEALYYYYLEGFSDFYAEYWWGVPATYSVAADSAYGLAVNKFLVGQLGLIPSKQFITDNPPEEFRQSILDEYKKLADDVSVVPEFEEDSYIIHQKLRTAEYGQRPPIIFGSSWERNLAKDLKGHIVEIAFPTSYEVVINRSYLGYRGALTLLEKIFTEAVSASA
jgi:nitrogenase molybdenum-iron protein beta chain